MPLAGIARGPARLDPQIAALEPAQFLETLQERSMANQSLGIILGEIREHADAPHPLALLRARHERPRGRRAAERQDERAALHSITSSARASSVGGILRLSALAVLRLMTSSNLIGCWTGSSAGFAPLRILPT